jgi:competence protein ComEA
MGIWLDKNRSLVFGLCTALTVVGAAVFYWRLPAQTPIEIIPAETAATGPVTPSAVPTASPTPAPVRIYITGAVLNSDVYFLPSGSIVKDAVAAAGGFTDDADRTHINLALEVQDQQQIHVPAHNEHDPPPAVQGGAAPPEKTVNGNASKPASGGRINLNTASLDELDTLPGIGPAIAQRIIDHRDSIGGFTAVEQITQVSGVGDATFSKIAPLITVEDTVQSRN